MLNNAVKPSEIGTVISEVLNSTEASEKLKKLNSNSYLNSYLINKDYKPLTNVIVKRIEEAEEPEANTEALKFYLHELSLIFNLETYYKTYFKGVAY